MKRLFLILTIALCAGPMAGPLLFAQASRNTRYVAVKTTPLKDSTGFFAKELGNLSLGTEVTVVREDGKWTEVRAGNVSGWVASASLSARRVVASNTNVSASEVALAGKGFAPDMEIEYKKNGLDYSEVDRMENLVIPADDLLKFITDGRLSRGE
jgi:SH3-like domain-containing protein